MHLAPRKRMMPHFQSHRGRKMRIRCPKSASTFHTCQPLFFLILFIFVKRPNCSSFKLTITKNYDENTKNLLGISFFNGNIVISPCNQSFRRLKSLWTTILIFFLLSSVFKLFHSAFKVLNDWFIPDQYDNNK